MNTIVFVRGAQERRIGGWDRKDQVKIIRPGKDDVLLRGYVLTTRRKGTETQTTHYQGESLAGFQPEWLAMKNGKPFKFPQYAKAA